MSAAPLTYTTAVRQKKTFPTDTGKVHKHQGQWIPDLQCVLNVPPVVVYVPPDVVAFGVFVLEFYDILNGESSIALLL